MMQGMPVDSPHSNRESSFHLRGSYMKEMRMEDEGARPSSAPPAVSASPADLISRGSSPSAIDVPLTEALEEINKRFLLNVSEHDHIEWLLKTGMLPLHNVFAVCDHLGYPRRAPEAPEPTAQPDTLPTPAPANVTGPTSLSPSAPPPGIISPFQSPTRTGIAEHYFISTNDKERPAGPCALPQ